MDRRGAERRPFPPPKQPRGAATPGGAGGGPPENPAPAPAPLPAPPQPPLPRLQRLLVAANAAINSALSFGASGSFSGAEYLMAGICDSRHNDAGWQRRYLLAPPQQAAAPITFPLFGSISLLFTSARGG